MAMANALALNGGEFGRPAVRRMALAKGKSASKLGIRKPSKPLPVGHRDHSKSHLDKKSMDDWA
jgi:hypothetical protein